MTYTERLDALTATLSGQRETAKARLRRPPSHPDVIGYTEYTPPDRGECPPWPEVDEVAWNPKGPSEPCQGPNTPLPEPAFQPPPNPNAARLYRINEHLFG